MDYQELVRVEKTNIVDVKRSLMGNMLSFGVMGANIFEKPSLKSYRLQNV